MVQTEWYANNVTTFIHESLDHCSCRDCLKGDFYLNIVKGCLKLNSDWCDQSTGMCNIVAIAGINKGNLNQFTGIQEEKRLVTDKYATSRREKIGN